MHALGLEFGSAAQLSKRPGSVWNCLWGNALLGSFVKSRVSYPGPGFLSSATWPSLPKMHYNGLNQTWITMWIMIQKMYLFTWDIYCSIQQSASHCCSLWIHGFKLSRSRSRLSFYARQDFSIYPSRS